MPTSDVHRRLVAFLADLVTRELGPDADIHADRYGSHVWPTPPQLGDARPDVFGRRASPATVLIGEAKTRGDIDHPHTELQLVRYFEYLKHDAPGQLWIAVPWSGLDEMYFMANRCRRLAGATAIPFQVTGLAWERSLYCRTLRA